MRSRLFPNMISLFVPFVLLIVGVTAFHPNNLRTLDSPKTQNHKDLSKKALMKVALQFMDENPAEFDSNEVKEEALSSKSFLNVLKTIETHVEHLGLEKYPPSKDPSYHFGAEQFLASNQRLLESKRVINQAIKKGDFNTPKIEAGRALHILQDFYSHSNWIELGNTRTNPALGVLDDIGRVAGIGEETCNDCPNYGVAGKSNSGDDGRTCPNNIKADIIAKKVLTSGYSSVYQNIRPKGKCSHGGLGDKFSEALPKGGINKESDSSVFSPHSNLHAKAAELAIEASVDFLNLIKDATDKSGFSRFIGLATSSTLCFVVDTTGSMADEIAAVRESTIRITRAQSQGGVRKPSDYVLVPFNDPEFGPAFKTTDPEKLIEQLNLLTASGGGPGGDTPELAYSGLQLAIQTVRQSSTCHFITDAPAKDENMKDSVISQAKEKQIKVNVWLTIPNGRRKRRSQGSRRKRGIQSDYEALAKNTGGSLLTVMKKDVKSAFSVVDLETAPMQVKVFIADNRRAREVSFPIDTSMSEVIVQVSDLFQSVRGASFKAPTGHPHESFNTITNLNGLKIYNLTQFTSGRYGVSISVDPSRNPQGSVSVSVTARSLVSFRYSFSSDQEGTVTSNPIRGVRYNIIIELTGCLSPFTGESQFLQNVTSLLLFSKSGDILQTIPLVELRKLEQYHAQAVLPSEDFRVGILGVDTSGNDVQRVEESVVTTATVDVSIDIAENTTFSILPGGEPLNVGIKIHSLGEAATWKIKISDNQDFLVGSQNIEMNLGKNATSTIQLNFRAGGSIPGGTVSTVTITTTSTSAVDNYLIFYISVITKDVDLISPTCDVTLREGSCNDTRLGFLNCSSEVWSMEFEARDFQSGISMIRPKVSYGNGNFSLDPFREGTNGSVIGKYASTCCFPNVTVLVVDGFGNVGECAVFHETTVEDIPMSSGGAIIPRRDWAIICGVLFVVFATLSNRL